MASRVVAAGLLGVVVGCVSDLGGGGTVLAQGSVSQTSHGTPGRSDRPGVSASARFPEEGIRRILVTTVTETSATVTWVTAEEEIDELVAWSRDRRVLRKSDDAPTTSHSVRLDGLQEDATYHFFLRGPSGYSYLSDFRTVAALPGEPEVTFAVVADPQFDGVTSPGARTFGRVVDEINRLGVDFVLLPGDLVDNRNHAGAIEGFTRDVHGYSKALLAPQSRRLVQMRYTEGRKPADIAEVAGLKLKSVYVALSRARRALRGCLELKIQSQEAG